MMRLLPLLLMLLPLLISSTLPSPPAYADQRLPAAPLPPPSFGLNSHLATRYPDPSSMALPAALLGELGVAWVREDFHWHRVQPSPNQWDWTFTDAAMRELLGRGINVLGVLGPSVGWGTPFSGDLPDRVSYYAPDPDAFVAYVRGVVGRYHRYVDHWEIWNEPDDAVFWRPQADPAAYAELLIRSAEAIRAIDPQAKILIGGVNPFDQSFLDAVAAAGAWRSFDILAIHPYVNPAEPEVGNLIAGVVGAREVAARYGEKPIWVTEIGWPSGPGDRDPIGVQSADDQANLLVRSMLLLWESGVEKVFWYTLKDDPGNPYGLYRYGEGRADFRAELRKPGFLALQTLIRETRDTTFIERRDLFEQRLVDGLESIDGWRRVSQPNGIITATATQAYGGRQSWQLRYNFTTRSNDYVAFERDQPLPLPTDLHGIGLWVSGDQSGHLLRAWLRDAEGEILQYHLGNIGGAQWQFLWSPIGGPVAAGNRIRGSGDGQATPPLSLVALVLDDRNDAATGSGTVLLDQVTAIYGPEVYNFRLQRGAEALDILWSPPGLRLVLNTRSTAASLIERDGSVSSMPAENGQLRINLGPAPRYLRHQR